mmetsp:Transcript_82568/g.266300  ORF Transcript_82568/g.266300 Transcript_82568/m.266300 type:complete len:529 (-) Transcript_82568:649-2235(-)
MGEAWLTARCVSEFLGTFVLVATVCANGLAEQSVWSGVSIGCSLAVMIYALGKASGAHFNPAVSVACGLAGKCPPKDVFFYIVSQLAGGILGALVSMIMYGEEGITLGPGDKPGTVDDKYTWWQACAVEFIYTFMLCFVILNVACSKMHAGRNQFYGLAIGFVIVACAYGGGNISGACLNPAIAVSLDIMTAIITGSAATGYSIMYTIAELLGAVLAAGLYRLVRPEDYTEGDDGSSGYPMSAKLVSEFLGTYMLVLTVGLNVLTNSVAGAFSISASLMCMIFALGTVSGAHFNPAVTVAVVASRRGKCSPEEGAKYIVVQLVAGILAARTYCLLTGDSFTSLKPAASQWGQVFIAELIWTAVLAFIVLSVATVQSSLSEYFGLAIGLCVTVGGCAIGGISGGSLNPAVSLAIASSGDLRAVWHFIPYAFIELSAGAMAAGLFYVTQPSEFQTEWMGEDPAAEDEEGAGVLMKEASGLDDVVLEGPEAAFKAEKLVLPSVQKASFDLEGRSTQKSKSTSLGRCAGWFF